jgi:invasion protein IalB
MNVFGIARETLPCSPAFQLAGPIIRHMIDRMLTTLWGDAVWRVVVQCNTVKDAKVCEMVQTLAQKDRRVVAQVAIGRLPTSDTIRAVLQVPTGVDLTKPASFSLSDSNKDKFVGRYVACTPRFCRSEIDLPAGLTKLPANLDKAAIHFHIPGKMVIVPMQSDGMVAAFDAVFKKAKG